jgi:hypothetical protein
MTPRQVFSAACTEATGKLSQLPVVKVMSRLDFHELHQIQHELAQHFETWFRHVCDTVDEDGEG